MLLIVQAHLGGMYRGCNLQMQVSAIYVCAVVVRLCEGAGGRGHRDTVSCGSRPLPLLLLG